MSQFADIKETIIITKNDCNLTEDQAIKLLIDIMGCIEWDLDDVDYDSDNWPDQERASARKALFG